jgi:hypothetical protein
MLTHKILLCSTRALTDSANLWLRSQILEFSNHWARVLQQAINVKHGLLPDQPIGLEDLGAAQTVSPCGILHPSAPP